ncbi:uncharacterized protein LOC119766816 [Culex quinquefasciatus]|uniref:uncharacterized protein LOC119766816 n=1 Tax=Culex quinquefasciatus TaxID=7176 RepID=UPI0018E2CE2F|nr:uncharacterized protein LOC119766816 [Culex quinquefasciatus]
MKFSAVIVIIEVIINLSTAVNVDTNPNFRQIHPTVHRNSDASVASVHYYLNDSLWELKLEPKTYSKTVRVNFLLNGTNSENDLSIPNCHYQVKLLLSVEG